MQSILDSVVKKPAAPQTQSKPATASVSILEQLGSPQKQRTIQQTSMIGSELSRLEQLQASVGQQMDLFPVKQSKPGQQQQRAQQQRMQHFIQQSENARSILESDLFRDKEQERERMMKMFTNEELKQELSHRDQIADPESETNSSINDRMLETEKPVKQGKRHAERRDDLSDIDFSLTKTGKSKGVSFAANTKKQGKQGLQEVSQGHVQDGVEDIREQLDQMRERTLEVQSGVNDNFSVEDSKLLEAVMEHILFYWDDIMACLLDELVEEEVLELNRIERIRSGEDPDREEREKLIDMLFEKKRTMSIEAPDLGFRCTREI